MTEANNNSNGHKTFNVSKKGPLKVPTTNFKHFFDKSNPCLKCFLYTICLNPYCEILCNYLPLW